MFSSVWPNLVTVWPDGIDTEVWAPAPSATKDLDAVVYDKIFRDREHYETSLVGPLMAELRRHGLVVERPGPKTDAAHQNKTTKMPSKTCAIEGRK
jgi:hypothetical protein